MISCLPFQGTESVSELQSREPSLGFTLPSSLGNSCLSALRVPCSALRADADASQGTGELGISHS